MSANPHEAFAQPVPPDPYGYGQGGYGYAPQPPPSPTHLPYHRLLRGGAWGANGWWRVVVGVIVLVVLVFLAQALPVTVLAVYYAARGMSYEDTLARLSGEIVTPSFLLVVNLGWAFSILVVWLVARTLHGLRPGWVSSVVPRMRWRYFVACLGLSLVALLVTVVLGAFLPAQAGDDVTGQLNSFTTTTRDFLLVVVLLTPLQAAGEEYVFRGYLTQAFGSLIPSPRVSAAVAVLAPSLLFALAHGAQDAPIFFDRFAFGVVAGTLVILTGGLEAAVAMHVLNNWLAFGLALAFGDMTSALNPEGSSWWNIPITVVRAVVYLALAVWVARRMGLATTTEDRLHPGSRLVPSRARM
ncbi:CPBP family intramembrane glutamic endopeptidase [Nocardioides nanhaiensis]|uniref:CAAX prenyl protease 2/Lysostaphin resistance protein A-like domain-containing protein n=1 Tax=Nocardioides nanhaiensis TaxID=1476871 RepID=A0ABP8W1T1_9ACTN